MGNGVPQLIQELVSELNTVLGVTGHIGNKLQAKHTLIFPFPINFNCHWMFNCSYLNDALHEVGLVVNQLTGGLVLDQVLDSVDVTETQRLNVINQSRGLVVLEVSAITGLVRQRLAGSVNGLRILLKDGDNLGALHGVGVLRLWGSGLASWGLGEALALLLGLGLGVAIGVLVPLELGRESPQHCDGSLWLTQTKSHSKGNTRRKKRD